MPADPDAATIDAFLGGRIDIIQPAAGHRAGLDAALLQAMIPENAAGHLVDLGTGTGVVALSAASRALNLQVTGVEIDPDMTAMAEQSLKLPKNQRFIGRVRFLTADAAASRPQREQAGLSDGSADWVTMNPPFERAGRVRQSPDRRRSQAHVGDPGALSDWIGTASGLLKSGGKLAVIHRADALAELLEAARGRVGAIAVYPVYPRTNEPATRLLLSGVKGSRSPLEIRPGIVLHEKDGSWTRFAKEILNGQRNIG